MRICRFLDLTEARMGIIENDMVYTLQGDMFNHPSLGERVAEVSAVQLLAPVAPSKIVCVGRNYADHAKELGNEVPTEPLLFFKPPSSIIGNRDAINLLPEMGKVDHEAELAVIIGKRAHNVDIANAFDFVLGYTCANDISDRDFQKKDGQWTRAKGFDTFCPLGPWIETSLDATDVAISATVNGDTRQNGRTSQMIFDVPSLITYISRIMTLIPGDLILTGTPAGVGQIRPNDVVQVSIDGIGTLENLVVMSQ